MEHPGAVGDDGASPAVRVGLPAPLAVVVGVSPAVAGHAVPLQCVVAYEPVAGVPVQEPPHLFLPLHVVVLSVAGALSHEPVARGRGPVDSAGEVGSHGLGRGGSGGGGGRKEEEEEEGEAERHAGNWGKIRRRAGSWESWVWIWRWLGGR